MKTTFLIISIILYSCNLFAQNDSMKITIVAGVYHKKSKNTQIIFINNGVWFYPKNHQSFYVEKPLNNATLFVKCKKLTLLFDKIEDATFYTEDSLYITAILNPKCNNNNVYWEDFNYDFHLLQYRGVDTTGKYKPAHFIRFCDGDLKGIRPNFFERIYLRFKYRRL